LILGNTTALKAAQCGQVIEANSVTVTAALAGPSAMSGNDTGLATSAGLCAMAPAISRSGEKARAASPVSERRVVKARRVMINGLLLIGAFTPKGSKARVPRNEPFASLKRPSWQWRLAAVGLGGRLNFA
jgi:hypothetical protein